MLTAVSCGGRSSETGPSGPEETVEAFNRAITAGDFAAARSLCDTVSMKNYLDSYIYNYLDINNFYLEESLNNIKKHFTS